jgi:hypothetical protein
MSAARTIAAVSGCYRSDLSNRNGCRGLDKSSVDQDCSHRRLLGATRVGHNTGYDGPLHKILRSSGR